MEYESPIALLTIMYKDLACTRRLLKSDKEQAICNLLHISLGLVYLEREKSLVETTILRGILSEAFNTAELNEHSLNVMGELILNAWCSEYVSIFEEPKFEEQEDFLTWNYLLDLFQNRSSNNLKAS